MLITSAWRGKCPVCGAPNCTCGGPSTTEGVTVGEAERGPARYVKPGPRPGLSVKITEAEAMRLGIVRAKKEEPVQNKKRLLSKNKGR